MGVTCGSNRPQPKPTWWQPVQNIAEINNWRHLKGGRWPSRGVFSFLFTACCTLRLSYTDCNTTLQLLGLSSATTTTPFSSCSYRTDFCTTLFRLLSWLQLPRRHEDVTLRKREQAGKHPGDFLTAPDWNFG